jgi:hypothetical protein
VIKPVFNFIQISFSLNHNDNFFAAKVQIIPIFLSKRKKIWRFFCLNGKKNGGFFVQTGKKMEVFLSKRGKKWRFFCLNGEKQGIFCPNGGKIEYFFV